MTRTVLNLLSRFARNVTVAFPSVAPDEEIPPMAPTLAEQSLRQMWKADPYGRFGWTRSPVLSEYDCVIAIGDPNLTSNSTPNIYIDGGGWVARISRNTSVDPVLCKDENPIGPAVAACIGGAEVFKTVVGASEAALTERITYDVYHHETSESVVPSSNPPIPDQLNLGTVRMIGLGSIGSATAYFLRRLPLNAEFEFIDYDAVELVNLNRSPLFTVDHAVTNAPKVDVARDLLADEIDVKTFQQGYNDLTFDDRETPDVVLPLANERNVRRAIQYDRPPLMLHATTTRSDVFLRRNIPLDEPCLLCHFPPASARFNPSCAEGEIPSADSPDENEPDAAFPFASFLAGSFLAGELAKLPLGDYPVTDSIALVRTLTDLSGVGGTMQYDKGYNEECPFCPEDHPNVHLSNIANTRFAHFTEGRT
jgi:molybdopterin/thiamine biosynthesis adenylyltransferase